MAVRRPNIPSQTSINPLHALLDLSGSLTRSKTGGVFSEALASVFAGTGLHSGVVHEATSTGLELVAEEGLSPALRTHIGSISSATPAWFVVQHAVKRRRTTVEDNAASMFGARVAESVLRTAGWNALASAPIVIGRDILGAITVAALSSDLFTPQRLAMLETVANVVALFLAREKTLPEEAPSTEGPTSLSEVDEKLTRLATLGLLALGFADDLRAVSSRLASYIKHQEKWLEQLRVRHPGAAPVIRELEPLQEEAASALMVARMSGGRLLAALDENTAEAVDTGSVVYDVVGHIEPTARARNVDILVAVQPGSDLLIRGKRSEIRQLVLGLVSDGIDTCGREDKPDHLAIPAPQMHIVSISVTREKNKILLAIEHSGKGTSTEHRQTSRLRAARPKESLGLLLARNIVASHSGSLEITRSDLGGALVRVVFPAATPPPSSKRSKGGPTSSKRARAAKETVPAFEVDVLASTERGSALAAGRIPPSSHVPATVTITDGTTAPPSTRRRSQAGPASKKRG